MIWQKNNMVEKDRAVYKGILAGTQKLADSVEAMIVPGEDEMYPAEVRELSLVRTKLQEAKMWMALAATIAMNGGVGKPAKSEDKKKDNIDEDPEV